MIVVTGSAGFIGSCLVTYLIEKGHKDLVLVDDFSRKDKEKNYSGKAFKSLIHRDEFHDWFKKNVSDVSFVFHLGARTDTTEKDKSIFDVLNFNYSVQVWKTCTDNGIPLVYASSAATYGDGSLGYKEDTDTMKDLEPMNPYGWSKHNFDRWALQQETAPPKWFGLKFFNVYGPNEYHKGRMASVVFHAFNQIRDTGKVRLFRSHRKDFKDGEQLRDFIFVDDVLDVCYFFYKNDANSGIYNVGTGKASTFLDLIRPIFEATSIQENIEFIDIPEDIRDTYQYFTEADISKLRNAGYRQKFRNVREGVTEYVSEYLNEDSYY